MVASIFQLEGNFHDRSGVLPERCYSQIAVVERGVGEPEPKGELRRYFVLLVPTVTYEDSFRVLHMLVAFLRVITVVSRVVFPLVFKRSRQFSRGTIFPKENLSQRSPSFLSRIPGQEQSRHFVEPPVHIHVATCVYHHEYIFVDRRGLFDELILPFRQAKRPVEPLGLSIGAEAHAENDGIRGGRYFFCIITEFK